MNYSSRFRKRPLAEINIVPYIDVMLVLLVIFMITTPLLSQGVHVKLPQAKAKTVHAKQQLPIIVSINAQGDYFLNITAHPQQTIHAKAILALVKQALRNDQQRSVLVKGDKIVPYGKVVRAMVLLQQAGVKNVGLVTENLYPSC
ncbi:MAG: protein TolR [Gammaproteobacteria bacterium]|nr:protein TolR [Gammaproteobacteria bacterium]